VKIKVKENLSLGFGKGRNNGRNADRNRTSIQSEYLIIKIGREKFFDSNRAG